MGCYVLLDKEGFIIGNVFYCKCIIFVIVCFEMFFVVWCMNCFKFIIIG